MTREQEAITYFEGVKKQLKDFRKIYPSPDTVGYQATTKEISFYDMAISALSAEPCEDCISRSNILNKIKEVCFSKEWRDFRVGYGSDGQRDFIIKYIENMLSVQSIRPKGKWSGHMYDTCSCCGAELHDIYIVSDATDYDNVALFCPHCGADMRGDN